jgi:4'-phosphopantetheinyl transferase
VAARAGLRQVLAGYGASAPEALTFTTGAHGKPALPGGPGFSLAHCEDLALCAVAPGREVGVDLERVRVVPEAEAIIGRWFGEGERQAWAAAGRSERAFIRLWTRREAFLKALGVGFGEDGPLRELDPDRWELFDLVPAEGHLGALIVARAERGFPLPLQPP